MNPIFPNVGVEKRSAVAPPGQTDYSSIRLSRHAVERFIERFEAPPETATGELRQVLARTRRLGRNPENGAIAVLGVHRGRALVAVLQEATCLTVLTWNQFVPRLADFGRAKLPRKWGRLLRRLTEPPTRETGDPDATVPDPPMVRRD